MNWQDVIDGELKVRDTHRVVRMIPTADGCELAECQECGATGRELFTEGCEDRQARVTAPVSETPTNPTGADAGSPPKGANGALTFVGELASDQPATD